MQITNNIFKGLLIIFILTISSCNTPVTNLNYNNADAKILFLHHSTGRNVWYGDIKQDRKINFKQDTCLVPRLLKQYNNKKGIKISIEEKNFPSGNQYSWKNYPYDYYNIWVKNAGDNEYMEEPTLEILTKEYNIIIFKHCFPVSKILADDGKPDVNSEVKTLANYKLQYNALKSKLNEFPQTKFIVWTGAALIEAETNEEEAKRAVEFAEWVRSTWNKPNDNIFVFDFRSIETEGGLYLKPDYATDADWDSHPNLLVSKRAASKFAEKIIEVFTISTIYNKAN